MAQGLLRRVASFGRSLDSVGVVQQFLDPFTYAPIL